MWAIVCFLPAMLMFSADQATESFQSQETEFQDSFLVEQWISNNNIGSLILFEVVGVVK